MDPVALDSRGYDGSYKLVGGEIALDFVNTVSWSGTDREHDWLDPAENIIRWAVAAGLLEGAARRRFQKLPAAVLHAELGPVRRIRAALTLALTPLAHGERPSREAIEALNDLVHHAAQRRRIGVRDLDWEWDEPERLRDLLAPVTWNAADIVTRRDHERLGSCPGCAWLFLDATRNRSRRWCDMNDCGSRDKALRYYHRTADRQRA